MIVVLPVNAAGISDDMKAIDDWLLWNLETRDGKATKVPIAADGVSPGKTNDPATWGTFDSVIERYNAGGYSGIGFVFDDRSNTFGIDLDACRNPDTGEIAEWARPTLDTFNSYTEISPSGTGVKIFGLGRLPTDATGKRTRAGTFGQSTTGKTPGIESYHRGRFFCVTGHALQESSNRLASFNGELTDWFEATFAAHAAPKKLASVGAALPFATGPATPDVLSRARQYAQAVDPAISGQRGHDTTLRLANVLAVRYALPEADAMLIFEEWNQTCKPPWTTEELQRKLAEALKSPVGQFGELRAGNLAHAFDDRPATAPVASATSEATSREAFTDVDGKQHVCGPDGWPAATSIMQTIGGSLQAESEPWGDGWFTVDELEAADLAEEFHLPGIIPCSQPIIFGGPPKGTKTIQCLEMLGCISTGHAFGLQAGTDIDGIPPQIIGRCAFVTCESGAPAIRKMLRRMATARGLESLYSAYPGLYLRTSKYDLCNPKTLSYLARLIVAKKIRVVAFDPAFLMMSGIGDDASSTFKMGGYLEPLTRLARDYGCAVILLHHFGKGVLLNSVGKKPELSWLSMAGFAEWARAWILISRREPYDHAKKGIHRLHVITGGPSYSHDWAVDVNEGLEGSQFKIEFKDGEAAAESEAGAKVDKRAERALAAKEKTAIRNAGALLGLLERTKGPITLSVARAGTGVALEPIAVQTAMQRLVVAGDVIIVETKAPNGRTTTGWALKP